MKTLDIDIISDVICPWCYLGQRRLGIALEALAGEIEARIRWKPYQLEPGAPAEGLPAFDYLARKIGGADRVRQSHDMLTRLGAEIGLPFAFDKVGVIPDTLDAHRLLHWAGQAEAGLQDRVAHALFTANFVEGRNVGDQEVLVEITAACGMDASTVRNRLRTDADRDTIRAEIRHAQQIGVTGVPFFVVAGKYALSGAQPVEVFTNALRQIAAASD